MTSEGRGILSPKDSLFQHPKFLRINNLQITDSPVWDGLGWNWLWILHGTFSEIQTSRNPSRCFFANSGRIVPQSSSPSVNGTRQRRCQRGRATRVKLVS